MNAPTRTDALSENDDGEKGATLSTIEWNRRRDEDKKIDDENFRT